MCLDTRSPDNGIADAAHDHGNQHRTDGPQTAFPLALAGFFDEGVCIWEFCLCLPRFLNKGHNGFIP